MGSQQRWPNQTNQDKKAVLCFMASTLPITNQLMVQVHLAHLHPKFTLPGPHTETFLKITL